MLVVKRCTLILMSKYEKMAILEPIKYSNNITKNLQSSPA